MLDTFTSESASVPKMLRNVAVLLVSPETDDWNWWKSRFQARHKKYNLYKYALQKHANMRMHISIWYNKTETKILPSGNSHLKISEKEIWKIPKFISEENYKYGIRMI